LEPGDISPVQPLLDQTGKQLGDSKGGWWQVFRWLEEKRYRGTFQFNEHVVVQLDSDACEEEGFDVPKTLNGVTRTPDELVSAIVERLTKIIGEEDMRTYSGRLHFAIAVHGIECWLLPLWGRAQEAGAILSCKQRVDNGLGRAKRSGLLKDDVRTYSSASSEFRKRKRLLEAADAQTSLGIFLASLTAVCP
jgi:hypothetical protein